MHHPAYYRQSHWVGQNAVSGYRPNRNPRSVSHCTNVSISSCKNQFLAAADGRVESIPALLDHPLDSTAEYEDTSTITPAAADPSFTAPTPEDITAPTSAEITPIPEEPAPTAPVPPLLLPPSPLGTANITPTAFSAASQSESHTTDAVPDNIRTEGNHHSDYDDDGNEGHINDEGGNIDEETEHDEETDTPTQQGEREC